MSRVLEGEPRGEPGLITSPECHNRITRDNGVTADTVDGMHRGTAVCSQPALFKLGLQTADLQLEPQEISASLSERLRERRDAGIQEFGPVSSFDSRVLGLALPLVLQATLCRVHRAASLLPQRSKYLELFRELALVEPKQRPIEAA